MEEARSQAQGAEAKAPEAGARVEQQALQIEELARQLEEARRQAAELLAGRDAQQPELELARAEAASAANQIDGLKAALSELTFQLKESRAGTEEQVGQLQSRFETLSNELEGSRAVAAELRRSREALERKVALLTKELEKAREGATELIASRNVLRSQIERTRSEAQIFEVRAQKADTQTQQQAWQIELLRKDLDEARTRAAELTAGRNLLQLQIEEAGWEPRPADGHAQAANGAAMQGKSNGAAQAIVSEAPGSSPQEQLQERVPDFDPVYYAECYPDVAAAGIDLLTHYIQHGRSEGRRHQPIATGFVSDESRFDSAKETIILVSHEASRTGAPILALNLAQYLSAKYNIITIFLRDGALIENFEEISSQVFHIAGTDRHPVECRYIIDAILRERQIRYAIVNSIVSYDCVPALGAAGIPIVMLIHEFASHARPLSAVREALIWATNSVFSAEVAANSFRREHATLLKGRVHVLPQGPCQLPAPTQQVDLNSQLQRLKAGMRPPGSENALVVLGVGFVHLRKGIDLFLTSAASALQLNPERQVRFVWIGHGYDPDWELNYSVYLAEQIARSGLEDRVVILDEVSDLEPAYAMADVFYLSSRLDPLPNVTIDAALRGLPIVCFEGASGMAEVLGANAAAGTTVVPHLDADAAARLILKLAEDKRLREQIGNATRAVAEAAFDMDCYVREIDKIGERAVESIRQRRADFETIIADPLFDAEFSRLARSSPMTREAAVGLFLAYWTNARSTLRPFPGFHPQIYAEHHPELFQSGINPLADYIRKGHPAGPWMNRVISAEEAESAPSATQLRAAIQAHFHYPELIGDFLAKLPANELRCDLLLSTNDEAKAELLRAATAGYQRGRAEVRVFPNRGRDIAPLLTGFGEEIAQNYDVIGHLHSKRSLALDEAMGETWREFLWQHLLGDRYPMMDLVLAQFARDEQLGLIFAEDPHLCGWDENLAIAEDIAERAGLPTSLPKFFNFPIGTMFWARTAVLAPLLALELDFDDYPAEPLANDGTMLHALERLLPFAAKKAGFSYATVHVPRISR